MSPRGGVRRKRGVPTGSARSRSDGIGTVGTDEAAGAGVTAVGGPGHGRGNSRRGVSPPGKWSRGPAGPKAIVDIGRCSTSCCCCRPACPGRDAVPRRRRRGHRRARRGRGGRGLARGLNRITPLSRTPRRSRLGDGRRGSRGFCGARADLGGYGEDRSESLSAAGKVHPRPGQRSTVVTDAETRATNLPEGAERSSILICGPCARKSQ